MPKTMKIKTKLMLGLSFLFLVILLIGSVSIIYIHRLATESKEILKDNYKSVQITKKMLREIDGLENDTVFFYQEMEKYLDQQEKNITEPGEKENTIALRALFENVKRQGITATAIRNMKGKLYAITDLNMDAILRKNDRVQATAGNVLMYIGVIGAICFVIVFTFIINFPGYIAGPVRKLNAALQRISERQYDQRIEIGSNDEFGELAKAFNRMAEKLEQYENSSIAQLMSEKRRIEAIIDTMSDAIIGLDGNGIILFANRQAVQLTGLTEQELSGRSASSLAVNNPIMRMMVDGEKENKPVRLVLDNKESYFQREHVPVVIDENKIGEVILLKNITRYEEQDQAKTNFIATISHELKTPIASIKLSSKLLEDDRVGELNEEQHKLVTNIKEDTDRLLKITGEVLNMTQVETGKIQLNFQPVKASMVIGYAADSLRFQASRKNISLVTNIAGDLPDVMADMEKTVWVLVNLLSNAIRYSPEEEEIIISAGWRGNKVKFSVQDFGKGIEVQYQSRVFDKYFQVPGGAKSGTGLGLAIAKEFILAQKGDIGLVSEAGKGSTFWFELPIA
jgi:PAS domain S-box-containing protein